MVWTPQQNHAPLKRWRLQMFRIDSTVLYPHLSEAATNVLRWQAPIRLTEAIGLAANARSALPNLWLRRFQHAPSRPWLSSLPPSRSHASWRLFPDIERKLVDLGFGEDRAPAGLYPSPTLPLPTKIRPEVPCEVPRRVLAAPVDLGLGKPPGFFDIAEERRLNRGRRRGQAGASAQARGKCGDQQQSHRFVCPL